MPTTRVRRTDDGFAVDIPADLAEQLGLQEGDDLVVSDLPNGFSATKPEDDFEEVMEAAHRFMDKHDEDFKRLAQ